MLETCPCGSGKSYVACCGRLHNGQPAPTAEALMRARYSAFAKNDVAYLLRSWAPETRPSTLTLDPTQSWIGLKIEAHDETGPETATVRFTARWKQENRRGKVKELSRFRRHANGWVYIDGDVG